ncbi:unnamed protein product, partial [Brassica napus]
LLGPFGCKYFYLTDAYVKAGFATDAYKLFDVMPERNSVSYVTVSVSRECKTMDLIIFKTMSEEASSQQN